MVGGSDFSADRLLGCWSSVFVAGNISLSIGVDFVYYVCWESFML